VSVVQVSVEVEAPPENVWSVIANPHNLMRWDRHIVGVHGVPPAGLAEGSEYTTDVRFLGMKAHSTSRVREFRPPEYSKVELDGLVEGTVETWLEPLDGGSRTRLRHRVEYRFIGGPLGRLAAGAVKRLGAAGVLENGVRAQKLQAEEG
jgi:carbon monoxide dehydrogenase subunit G